MLMISAFCLHNEAKSWLQAKKSEVEVATIARERTIRELAENQVDESLDMVKMLNSLGARAAAFTIRDRQLDEIEQRKGVQGVRRVCCLRSVYFFLHSRTTFFKGL